MLIIIILYNINYNIIFFNIDNKEYKENQNKVLIKCKEINNLKIEVDNIITDRLGINYNKYELISEENKLDEEFGQLIYVIEPFLKSIWKSPKSIATILLKSDKNDIKTLAHLITHNIYDNIFSSNNKEEQLIYIIYILLQEEINNLNDTNSYNNLSSFLKETPCRTILEEFYKKKEIQSFFKNILNDIIKEMETSSSQPPFFEFEEILKKLKNEENDLENEDKYIENKKKVDKFTQNYYFSLKKENLETLSNNNQDKMKDFYKQKALDCNESSTLYSVDRLLENISYFQDNSNEIWAYYIESFIDIVEIIDKIFNNLLNNSDSLPYTIKCICKIISILIHKKNPDLNEIDQNLFIAKFFFEIILFPLLKNPSYTLLINEFLITEKAMDRIRVVLTILKNLVIGQFFKEDGNLTPFNVYIFQKIPKLVEFFDNINQVELPSFIEQLINDKLPDNYEYDYFKENPEEDIYFINIYYNINELYTLIINSQKLQDSISISEKIISKFKYNMKRLEELKSNFEIDITSKKIIKFYLFSKAIFNEKNENMIKDREHFILKEYEKIESDTEKEENNIIKIKNFFYSLLYITPTVSKSDFNLNKLIDLKSILNELKNISNINSFLFMDQKSVPYNWYINSVIQYLPLLPDDLTDNDFKKLLNELEKEITNSIEEIKFEKLTRFIEYLKVINKKKFYFTNIKSIITDIDLNKKLRYFIEKVQIPARLMLKDNILSLIKPKEEKENLQNTNTKIYNTTIKKFIRNFPNIANNYDYLGIEVLDLIQKMKAPEILEEYFYIVNQSISNEKIMEEINLEKKYEKIYDYIMEQLYEKLFPKIPDKKDNDIFKICCENNWIEPSNLINSSKNYIFESYLPDAIKFLNGIVEEKSPRKKILCIKEIFNCIIKLGKFNEDKVEGLDNLMPLLEFTFIKAKPKNFYSNCKYIELFLGSKKKGEEASNLTSLFIICEKILNLSFKDFYNISKEKYEENCKLSSKN